MLILLAADYFSGKTVSACTFIEGCITPEEAKKQNVPEQTLLFLDIDNGFDSVKNTRDKLGNLVVPRWNEIIVEKFHRPGFKPIYMKTPDKNGFSVKNAPEYTQLSLVAVESMNKILQGLYTDSGKYKGKQIFTFIIIHIYIFCSRNLWIHRDPLNILREFKFRYICPR